MTYFLTIMFLMVSILLILVILVQRGRGGGLSGAFGMGGGGGAAFGTKTGDVFTTITVVLFAIFLLMAIGLNYVFKSTKSTPLVAPAPTSSVPALPGANTTTGLPPMPDNISTMPAPAPTAIPAPSAAPLPAPAPAPATTPAK